MSDDRRILELLASRRGSLPLWASDLLAPYVHLTASDFAVTEKSPENPNACAMTPTRKGPTMKLGTAVIFGKHTSNGSDEQAAIVTRVWGDEPFPTVNLKVLPDFGEPFDAGSVVFWRNGPWQSEYYYREAE